MSASIRGGFPLSSSSNNRRRRPSASGLSLSSPDVPQLHSMPTRHDSPQTHPPTGSPYIHHHHHHREPSGGPPLQPLTPLHNPATASHASSHSSSGGTTSPHNASSLSLTSISSTSTNHTTTTGISRASSTRSTSSVQAVPMRKPQRAPAVPRIVTRGMNALGAYGVGPASAAQSPTRERGGAIPGEEQENGTAAAAGWARPKYDRADSSKKDDSPRLRHPEEEPNAESLAQDAGRPGTVSPSRVEGGGLQNGRPLPPTVNAHERQISSSRTATPGSPASPTTGRRPDWAAAGEERRGRPSTVEERQGCMEQTPNAMGVVGNRRSTEDFEFGEVLGEGSYSTVTHVTTVHPPYRQYALKVLDKEHIKRERKTKYVLIERDTLKALDGHPGIVKLWWTFQDEWSLCRYGSFDLRSARYYLAQILSAVGFMHDKGIIHRDLKPENILLDRNMRVKITDFGTAKLLKKEEMANGHPLDDPMGRPRTRSFVGTPEYVSPEILSEGRESSFSSDFWALGCVLFQMLAGRPPFQARTEYLMFQKIINLEYEFPLGFPADAKDLVEKLLVVDPKARLGGDPAKGNGIEQVKNHPFFTSHIAPSASPPISPIRAGDTPSPVEAPGAKSVASSVSTGGQRTSGEEEKSTPASSVHEPFSELSPDLASQKTPVDALTGATAALAISTPEQTPPMTATPHAELATPEETSVAPTPHPLDAPVDWSTIWVVQPPQIKTGLTPPAPTIRGEFVLLGENEGADSSQALSTAGTGLTGGRSYAESGVQREEDAESDFGDRGSVSEEDDGDDVGSSPTSANDGDLPATGPGKWAGVLLPSETILMLSPVLQKPSSSAAAARTAILSRSSRIKLPRNPLTLISSAASAASAPPSSQSSPQNGTIPLPSPSSGGSASSFHPLGGAAVAAANSPPTPPPGSKPRTLILTDYPRLLCIKETPDYITVKSEVFLGSALRGGVKKEGASAFVAVEPSSKDSRGFTVKTSARNYKYEEPYGHATRWVHELREAHQTGLLAWSQQR
ncbi:3-phosphoinositide dependent protein kinase-1 [Rhodotorula toruloides]|uniref:non-specific serine/threonine protein kinase n=1 Tax=Rhodotorula toruloides TaxID=5286 RepID=A0A511KQF8_RHOTO|nr:3-phosphoinositide dependent protein kinase-1 [Rhodotorula toruloides]